MSLLSDYNGFGFVGGTDCGIERLRVQVTSTFFTNGAGYSFAPELTVDNNISYIVQHADPATAVATGNVSALKFDFSTKRTEFILGAARSNTSSESLRVLPSPFFNGWYIDGNPFSGSDSTWYTNDFGASYSATDVTTQAPRSTFNNGQTGGWWDGTTMSMCTGTGVYRYTTNGTNFTTVGTLNSPFFWKNNRSNYSGYWFGRIDSPSIGYAYRTSAAGSLVNVTGYYLTAMSANGRYLQRIQTSGTYNEEYSTDGGASWSTFTGKSPYTGAGISFNSYGQSRRFCSDSGQFFILSKSSNIFVYDFTTNKWILCAAPVFWPTGATGLKVDSFRVQGVECLLIATEVSGLPPLLGIMDMPKGLA